MESSLKICEKFKIQHLQDYQKDAIQALMSGRDVFISKKTGAGKSLCYQGFSTAVQSKSVVIVVSPLKSIMEEQCTFMNQVGIKAIIIGNNEEDNKTALNMNVEYIFASPELLLGDATWRGMVKSAAKKMLIKLIAIDEAHLVLQWGEVAVSSSELDAFRPWYGKLGELRSLAPHTPVIALTATANKEHRTKIQKKLHMKTPYEIIDSPDRPNVKLFTLRFSSNTDLAEMFGWLLDMLLQSGPDTPRTLVFTKTIDDCAKLYNMCLLNGSVDMCSVQMFHSMTPDSVKDAIRINMCDENGAIRILFCTNAAGMGVNYKGIQYVINYGPPQDMDTFLQHIGRAGRTGEQAQHLLMYTGRQLRNLTTDMLQYVRNDKVCRREIQLKHYKAKPQSDRVKHLCCDICDSDCTCSTEDCKGVLVHPAIQFFREEDLEMEEDQVIQRHVTEEDMDSVKISLELYAENLAAGQELLPEVFFGINSHIIDEIIHQLEYIDGPDHLLTKCGVTSFGQALDIYKIICTLIDVNQFSEEDEKQYTHLDDK